MARTATASIIVAALSVIVLLITYPIIVVFAFMYASDLGTHRECVVLLIALPSLIAVAFVCNRLLAYAHGHIYPIIYKEQVTADGQD